MATSRNPLHIQRDVLRLTEEDYAEIGTFDLVRMQHVFEHFSFEEGLALLDICDRLLLPDGYLLITVPDLRKHIRLYMSGYKLHPRYLAFAQRRIPKDAPPSAIFSVFAHQFGYFPPMLQLRPGSAHKWCYDYAGLQYQVERCGKFTQVRRLPLWHPLAGVPFTHNRPQEDVCLLARKRQ